MSETDIVVTPNLCGEGWVWRFRVDGETQTDGTAPSYAEAQRAARDARELWEDRDRTPLESEG